MRQIINETAPIRAGEELDWARLVDYLHRDLPAALGLKESSAPLAFEQFPGGHSNLTYLVRYGEQELVLRRPPVGPVAATAHDMRREFRMLAAINPVFPLAPQPYLLCEDMTIMGVPFYLMERRRGIVVRREMPPEIGDDLVLRRRVSESLVDALADLHAVNLAAPGLENLGRPAGFVARQVTGPIERWQRSKTVELPAFERVIEWLQAHLPPDAERPTLLHNDYKLDNVMLDAAQPSRVAAILDWEMSAVGDPLVDLGILLCYWPQAGDAAARRDSISAVTTMPGWLTRDEIIERYAARTGRDLSGIAFYEVFAIFKVAVVLQQIYYRYRNGQTRDERFADFEQRVAGLAEVALALAQAPRANYLCLNEAGRPHDLV